jgi:hypothetical protein
MTEPDALALKDLVEKWRGQQRGWLQEQPNYSKAQVYAACADELETVLAGLEAAPHPQRKDQDDDQARREKRSSADDDPPQRSTGDTATGSAEKEQES